jgi:hypothetical protein
MSEEAAPLWLTVLANGVNRSRMHRRAALALILLGSLLVLAPLAYASLPDPTWVSGVYDDADFDAIVDFITSEAGVVEQLGAVTSGRAEIVVIAVVGGDEDPAPSPLPFSDAIRAPPVS